MKKTVIILEHSSGRLGNQLWSYANVYAYCLERGYSCKNYSFYHYTHSFPATHVRFFSRLVPWRANRKLATLLARRVSRDPEAAIIRIADNRGGDPPIPFYLPPSAARLPEDAAMLEQAEHSNGSKLYFSGWLFRNPEGLAKYHGEIVKHLRPRARIRHQTESSLRELRLSYTQVIGVHIRQGDYRDYMGGRFFFSMQEVRAMLNSYLAETGRSVENVFFIICSDGPIDRTAFNGLCFAVGRGGLVSDLYTLSSCDRIIGSDSTFGGFAAFYGDIPITFFSRERIDWQKAEGEKHFTYQNGSYNLQP